MNPPGQTPRRIVVPTTTRREMVVATLSGLGVLVAIGYGVFALGKGQRKAARNTISGRIQKKTFTPSPEQQISVGRGGLNSREFAGEYILEVFVKSEDRTFQVPVDDTTYEAARVGDSFTFTRPPSEQAK
jgi:hypothetical protein